MTLSFTACHKENFNSDRHADHDVLRRIGAQWRVLDFDSIHSHVRQAAVTDKGGFAADRHTRALYVGKDTLLWFGNYGTDMQRIDTLLEYISETAAAGTDTTMFGISDIRRDLAGLKTMTFDGTDNINTVIARLEYNLTKTYLRYASSQCFGFVNGSRLLNHYEETDTAEGKDKNKFKHLYDIPLLHPDDNFYDRAVRMASADSFDIFIREIQPEEPLYYKLTQRLKTATDSEREKIICNIERCRWRQADCPSRHKKHVMVNIPSFSLYAVDGDSTMVIRIICGAKKTKSPLLTSRLTRIDLNPRWIVPVSIAKGIVYDTAYLNKENMYIYDRKAGRVSHQEASLSKILSNDQYIVQERSDKNSLGRIIFRFENNFAIYLHHTSTPWLFERASRAFSHGCIRVEKPVDLARFVLGDGKDDVFERIKYSFSVELEDKDEPKNHKSEIDRDKMINTVTVEPQVPLFINYYTCYYNDRGDITVYDDVYGYDEVIIEALKPYIR